MPRGTGTIDTALQHECVLRDLHRRPFEDDCVVHADVKSQVDLEAIESCRRHGIIDDVTVKLLLEDRLVLDSLLDHEEGCCPWKEGVPWRLPAMHVRLHRVWNVIMQLAEMHGSLGSKGGICLRKWAGINVNMAHLGENVSLLAMATQFAGPEVVGALLELRADPSACVRVGVSESDADMMPTACKKSFAEHVSPTSCKKSFMEHVSPLHLAAKRGSPDILKRLLAVRMLSPRLPLAPC